MIENDRNEADAYFWLSVALMHGKRPFLLTIDLVKEIINNLETAIMIYDKSYYHYFLAYIKYDFYTKKYLKVVPTYEEELKKAYDLGINTDEISGLKKILGRKLDLDGEF